MTFNELLENHYTYEGLMAWLSETHYEVYEEWMNPNRMDAESESNSMADGERVFVVSSVDYNYQDGNNADEEVHLPQEFTFTLDIRDIGNTTDMQEIADELVDSISDETGWLVQGFYFQERMADGTLVDLDAESFSADSKFKEPYMKGGKLDMKRGNDGKFRRRLVVPLEKNQ